MADTNPDETTKARERLANWVVIIAGIGVIILAICIVGFSKNEQRTRRPRSY